MGASSHPDKAPSLGYCYSSAKSVKHGIWIVQAAWLNYVQKLFRIGLASAFGKCQKVWLILSSPMSGVSAVHTSQRHVEPKVRCVDSVDRDLPLSKALIFLRKLPGVGVCYSAEDTCFSLLRASGFESQLHS